jgi:hypothetical protein
MQPYSLRGLTTAWTYHCVDLPLRGLTTAWTYHCVDLPLRGLTTARQRLDEALHTEARCSDVPTSGLRQRHVWFFTAMKRK